jgi:hypothetical protein
VNDVRLVPLGFQAKRGGGGPSLQGFDAEGESLFDDVEEQHRLVSGFRELNGMAKHMGSLFAALRALADAMKTKSVSAGDSLSATLEVRFTSGALAPKH